MVTLPKMLELSITSETDQSMTLMFFFMDVFSMLITGILINSILSTSIEERIREFGIMRTVGAKKSFTIGLVVITGLLMALIGTAIGLILGLLGGPFFIQLVTSSFSAVNVKIPFVIFPTTILETAAIGVGVTTAIAILPALKAGRVSIIQAIDPSRANQKEEWHFKKEGSANAKLMIFRHRDCDNRLYHICAFSRRVGFRKYKFDGCLIYDFINVCFIGFGLCVHWFDSRLLRLLFLKSSDH